MIEIKDFVAHATVAPETIDRYRGRVPDDLIDIWQRYGYGTFGQGFFKLIDPDFYLRELDDRIVHIDDDGNPLSSIPIMATGLADLICWEPGDVGLSTLLYRNQAATGLGPRLTTMFTNLNYDGIDKYGTRTVDWDMYPKAVEAHGPLAFDESFTYVPLLSLGGDKTVENMQKRETITAIKILVEFQGVIEH